MEERKSSRTGKLARSIFNPRVWMGYDQIKDSSSYLFNGIYKLFTGSTQPASKDNFENLQKRMNLNDEQLSKRKRNLVRLTLLMVLLAVLILVYAAFQLLDGNFHTATASLVVFAVLTSMAFRYHFWWFQIDQKRLGCTFREWLIHGLFRVKR